MSEWKYAVGTRMDTIDPLEQMFRQHTCTIVGHMKKPSGARYYQVKRSTGRK
jgi:hypothetical protein